MGKTFSGGCCILKSMNRNYKNLGKVLGSGLLIVGGLVISTANVSAATPGCTFIRDLQMGVVGDDVKCLQKYLNDNGFAIATTGAGAKGKETGEFKALTEAALVRWQKANKLSPASGYFGPRSQQVFKTLQSGGATVKPTTSTTTASGVDTSEEALLKKIAEIKSQLSGTVVTKNTETKPVPVTTTVQSNVGKKLKDIISKLKDAEGEVADNDDADNYDNAVDSLSDARSDFYKAVLAYIGGDSVLVTDTIKDIENSIADALDVVGASSKASDAKDAISAVRKKIKKTEASIDLADKDGKATTKSEALIKKAKTAVDEAGTALSDEEYDDVNDLVDDADSYLDDAIAAIGKKNSSGGVEQDIKKARSDYSDVLSDVKSALKDGDTVGDAESLLSKAKSKLNKAQTAIDDSDDDAATDYIDAAVVLIKNAQKEL